jgi:triphosphatase
VCKLLEARREKAYDALVAALDAPAVDDLLLRLVQWIEAGDWTHDAARTRARAEPMTAFVQRKFSKLIEKFGHRCEALEQASFRERHRTRIQAKNLRYGVEFLDNLVRIIDRKSLRKQQRALIAALKQMQTFLGEENDVLMAHSYFAGLGQDQDLVPADAAAVAAGAALAARLSPSGKRKFHKTVAKARASLADVKPFWLDLAKS